MRYYKLDESNHPVQVKDMKEWAIWLGEYPDKKIVGKTLVTPKVEVSTVFLGIDHGFDFRPDSRPVLFETMVFGGPIDGFQVRTYEYSQAKLFHEYAVHKVGKSLWQRLRKRKKHGV